MKTTEQLAARNLAAYAKLMWPPFVLARHNQAIVEVLEDVECGRRKRVIINIPPRHGKSLLVSTLFPAWYLGRHPDHFVIASSYGQELASDFGRQVRNYVGSGLHRGVFPACVPADDSFAVHRFNLMAGGAYYGVGVQGSLTGRGANLFIIDDPIKNVQEAFSATERRAMQQWFEHVAYTRLQPDGKIIIIQTRWHLDDLSGWLLREHPDEGWFVLNLPAIAEDNDILGRAPGEALWPERFPLKVLERTRSVIGTAAWLAEYQGRPIPQEGSIFKLSHIKTYDAANRPALTYKCLSLDCAYKTGQSNDYSVILALGEANGQFFVLDVDRKRMEFPELIKRTVEMRDKWGPHEILIEDTAAGISLVQALRETFWTLKPIKPDGDKQARAQSITGAFENGKVYVPTEAHWLRDFVDELTSFPGAAHDDQVDALVQALRYVITTRGVSRPGEAEELMELHRRFIWNQPMWGFDSPGALDHPGRPRNSIGTDGLGRPAPPLYGSCEQFDRWEDAMNSRSKWTRGGRNRGLPRGFRTW